MKMDEKTIKEILLKGERMTLECNKAKAEMPNQFGRRIRLLLNK